MKTIHTNSRLSLFSAESLYLIEQGFFVMREIDTGYTHKANSI